MKYRFLAIAGTFDRLHKGHQYFISQAFRLSRKVIIGLTSDQFAAEKLLSPRPPINNYQKREEELRLFLREKGWQEKSQIVKIDDIYGPSLKDTDIEVLVVTEETREGAQKVNQRRQELRLPPLKIIEVPLVLAQDKIRISSTRIRLGEINRWGKVFSSLPIFGNKIPANLRLNLKKPLGLLISGNEQTIRKKVLNLLKSGNFSLIIAVGDEATTYLNKLGEPHSAKATRGRQADISIIDYHIKRKRVKKDLAEFNFPEKYFLLKAENPAGSITIGMVASVEKAIKSFVMTGKKTVIEVTGEEDLAGLPAILLAPLDSLILYGQPNQGIVAVKSTEEKKNKILELINGN